MFAFTILTTILVFGLSIAFVLPQMSEISANWVKYKDNPFVIFASPLLKPENDKRTRMEFASDALKEGVSNQGSKVFQSFMDPVFSIFRSFSDTINTLLNSLMGIRELFRKFFESMLRILDPFKRRINLTVSQLRATFINLNNAMSKVAGVATGAVYAGLSLIRTIMNMFELMKAVSIAILVILVAMVFWFWFILWPIIPLIMVAISMIASSGGGESVSGMASAFCFDPNTEIKLSDNSNIHISEIKIGQKLSNNSIVEAVLEFEDKENKEQFYNYKNIIVSGSHIVYENNKPIFVRNSEFAIKADKNPEKFYCLITSTRTIPVVSKLSDDSEDQLVLFADWEELDENDIDSLFEWNKNVFETLNKSFTTSEITKPIYMKPDVQTIQSESAIAYETLILTQHGKQKIHTIKPGMFVYDEKKELTKVVGIVKIDSKLITGFLPLDYSSTSAISNASWIKLKDDSYYSQISTNKITKDRLFVPSSSSREFWHSQTNYIDCLLTGYDLQPWYNLITESGSFTVCDARNNSFIMRDFSDIGQDNLESTYENTIEHLEKKFM